MFVGNTIRSFELPNSVETTIDDLIRIVLVIKGIQWVWKKRIAFFDSCNFVFGFLTFLLSPVFYELSTIARKIRLEKQANSLRSLSAAFFVAGNHNMGKGDEIFFALMLSALGNKNSSKEYIQFVLTGMVTFLFVKALSNRSQSGETQMINE